MNGKQLFKKHYSRLVLEGAIRSALAGVATGFAVDFAAAFVFWMLDVGGIWPAIGLGAGAAVISGLLFYFLKFRPSEVEVARRLDRLGLKERMVTMLEYKADDSYIANLQRENAKEHLDRVSGRRIRIRISRALVVMLTVAAVFAASMTTVLGLSENDIIPPGGEIILPDDPLEDHIPVTYLADEGGEIEGETDQLVPPGGSTTPVVAVADEGWMFVGWDDGNENPERSEDNVTVEWVFIAVFEEVFDGEGDGSEDESTGKPGSPEGDSAEDVPGGGDANVDSEQSGPGEKGDGSGSDGDSDGGQGSTEDEGEGKGDGQGVGAGGKWQENNQFIDGKTYYKDYLDMYYQWAQEIFENDGEIPPELREFYETYINGI